MVHDIAICSLYDAIRESCSTGQDGEALVTTDEAKDRLYDTTFLIGAFRRRSAIKALAEGPDSSGVVALAQALQEGHPEYGRIRRVLRQLSALRDDHKAVSYTHLRA